MTWVEQLKKNALIGGAVCLALGGVGFAVAGAEQFYRSYLIGFCFWVGIPFGCLGIQMIHALTGGRWGPPIRRTMYAASTTLPLFLAILFLPLLGGNPSTLSRGPGPDVAAQDPSSFVHKAAYT